MNYPQESDCQFVRERLAEGCDHMKRLLLGMLDPNARVAEDIHEIRKLGKSLRGGFAIFRLDQSAAPKIQAIGRVLAGPRDAVTRLNTWTKLAWHEDSQAAAAIAGLLEQQTHAAARRPPPNTIAWCVHHVEDAHQELLSMPASRLAEHLASGLAELEQKTVKRCHKLDHRDGPAFHKARKALKAWLGALSFLPEGMVDSNPLLKELASLLGDENDLSTMAVWLKRHGFTTKFAPDLWHTLTRTRHQLQRKVIRHAGDLIATHQE